MASSGGSPPPEKDACASVVDSPGGQQPHSATPADASPVVHSIPVTPDAKEEVDWDVFDEVVTESGAAEVVELAGAPPAPAAAASQSEAVEEDDCDGDEEDNGGGKVSPSELVGAALRKLVPMSPRSSTSRPSSLTDTENDDRRRKTALSYAASLDSLDDYLPPPPPSLELGSNYIRPGAFRMSTSGTIDDDEALRGVDYEQSPPPPELFAASSSSTASPPPPLQPAVVVEASLVEASPVGGDEFPESGDASGLGFRRANVHSVALVEAKPMESQNPFKNRRVQICMLISVLLIAGAIVGVVLGVTRSENNRSNSDLNENVVGSNPAPVAPQQGVGEPGPSTPIPALPTQSPSLRQTGPTAAPTIVGPTFAPSPFVPLIELFQRRLPSYTQASLTNPDSPQSKALAWLDADPNITNYSSVRLTQRFALATIYHALGGDKWFNNSGWMSYEVSECDWYYHPDVVFVCAENETDVTSIGLVKNNLNGTIPLEVGLLTSVDVFALKQHPFVTGPIPTTIEELQLLQMLDLLNNELSGVLVSNIFKLPLLSTLDVEQNNLEGTLPTELGNLSPLKFGYFGGNNFSKTIPSELSSLSNAVHLWFGENQLSGTVPVSLRNLTSLESLDFFDNLLTGHLSDELFKGWSQIIYLGLGRNAFRGTLSSHIGSMSRLSFLDYFDNSMRGSIPTHLGLLTSVTGLYFNDNLLNSTIPSYLGLCTGLETLHLYNNAFSGLVPPELCRIYELDLAVDCDRVECNCGCNCDLSGTR